jgi:hypothetical protein
MPTAVNDTGADSPARPPMIGPLGERDLPEAERIFRLAFGTFLGVPEPETFWSDRDYVYGRSRAPHVAALGATLDGLIGGCEAEARSIGRISLRSEPRRPELRLL